MHLATPPGTRPGGQCVPELYTDICRCDPDGRSVYRPRTSPEVEAQSVKPSDAEAGAAGEVPEIIMNLLPEINKKRKKIGKQ